MVSIIFYPSIVKAKDDAGAVKPEKVEKEEPAKEVSILSVALNSKRLIYGGTICYDLSSPLLVMYLNVSLIWAQKKMETLVVDYEGSNPRYIFFFPKKFHLVSAKI